MQIETTEVNKTISIGNDHAGVAHKNTIVEFLQQQGWTIYNHGTNSEDSVDYPDHAHPVANDVESGKALFGVLICGSANGVCMSANKHQGIRAALSWNEEIATLGRSHNNANVVCIPARYVSESEAVEIVKAFIETSFEGGRHSRRVEKISKL